MAQTNSNTALDWAEELIAPEEHAKVILDEGEYAFDVTEFKRGRFAGSDKICACPQAEVTLNVYGIGCSGVPIKERFPLNNKMLWKLVPFLKAIGLVDSDLQDGDKFKVAWDKVQGAHGACYVEPDSFVGSDGNEVQVNRITRYLSKAEASQKRLY